MPFDAKAAEEIIALLPPGADAASARLALGALAIFWEHAPAGLPDAPLVPLQAATLRLFAKASRDRTFAWRFAQARALIAAAMQGKRAQHEALYTALLRIWVEAGGELTIGGAEITSPCVHYLTVAVAAITGKEMTISGVRKIVRRYRERGSRET